MKTKAYKTREIIARYLYNRMSSRNFENVKVMYDKGCHSWAIYDENDDEECSYEAHNAAHDIGIMLYYTPNKKSSVVWDKEREKKYAEMNNAKHKEIIIHLINDFYGE